MPPSRKEQRRLAALREAERRARITETRNIEAASNLNWGSGASLSLELRRHIIRLGGLPNQPISKSVVKILAHQIKWPTGRFRSSAIRYCEQNSLQPESVRRFEIQDLAPLWCFDFEFAENGSFYDEWRDHFRSTDPHQYVPIGSDSHYFYLLHENSIDPSDPLVSKVDHETVDEEPHHPDGATISKLLATLISV